MAYSVDKLLVEAAEAELGMDNLIQTTLGWTCTLYDLKGNNRNWLYGGHGNSAAEAIHNALNNPAPKLHEIKITGYTPSLDSLLKGLPDLSQFKTKIKKESHPFDRRGL